MDKTTAELYVEIEILYETLNESWPNAVDYGDHENCELCQAAKAKEEVHKLGAILYRQAVKNAGII